MNFNISTKLIRMFVIGTTVMTGIMYTGRFSDVAFADNLCLGPLACSAIGGNGGHGGDTGDAIGGDIGPGASCFANNHVTIGDECVGSTGSSEPRSGSGHHSMNGGRGGSAHNNLEG